MPASPSGRDVLGRLLLIATVGWPGAGSSRAEVPPVVAADFDPSRRVSYAAQVAPALAVLGCNAGACHGKTGGQHGFALSLFGSDPAADRQALRARVDPVDPAASLLLLKPTGQVPHGGGPRLAVDSAEYRDLVRWIGQAAGGETPEATPRLVRLDMVPPSQTVPPRGRGAVRVVAHWDDGSRVDVTRLSRFESSRPPLLEVTAQGEITAGTGVGAAAILVRYGADLTVARVVVPTGRHLPSTGDLAGGSTIDRLVAHQLGELGVVPAGPAPDAEFARRSALDILGRLPDVADVAAFEQDARRDKRARWVDSLLDRPEYADFFASKWSAILRNRRTLGDLSKPTTFAFHAWIREAIAENWPFDRFAAAIIAARGDVASNPNVGWYRHVALLDERAADVAQVFLGTRIGCARCHHHPTGRWSQDDYRDFAAFFERVGTKVGPDPTTFRVFHRPPGPGDVIRPPRPLGARGGLVLDGRADPRDALVADMVRPENPALARTVVNRFWKHFLGRGLVEPEDDFRSTNPTTHPALLDALAGEFVAHRYDTKWLIRAIATSDTYARSSLPAAPDDAGRDDFARFTPRRLPAEVLLDAIDTVAGTTGRFEGVPSATRATQLPDDGFSSPFLDAFGRPERRTACECERTVEPSLMQALFLLNWADLEARLSRPLGRAARLAGSEDVRPDAVKLDELYRVALSRSPSDSEVARGLDYLAHHRAQGQAAAGFVDLIWAVINGKEFLYNH